MQESCAEQFAAADSIINPPFECSGALGTAVGSGFFISGDGYIVTNNHVVANGRSFEVTTDDGRTYQAKVIGSDPQTDVALIKISVAADFPYVTSFVAIPNG